MIRWGIIGCGRIARSAIAPAIKWSSNGTLAAIASRSVQTAERLAHELGAERAFASYQALLDDPAIDAVYLGLPNGMHAEWCERAANAGKHVLCEKSLTLDPDDALALSVKFARRRLRLVEAFMYRHHPQWKVVFDEIPRIGDVRSVHAALTGMLESDDDHRWTMGGALFDVTCYGVNAARWILGEPIRVAGVGDRYAASATLEFPRGALATVHGSLRSAPSQALTIIGTRGTIVVERPFIPNWTPTRVVVNDRAIEVAGANHFLHQVEHFASLVLDPKRALDPAEDGSANVAVCAEIQRSC